jgi:ABC-type glycerol-3-phosphate transport system permease component
VGAWWVSAAAATNPGENYESPSSGWLALVDTLVLAYLIRRETGVRFGRWTEAWEVGHIGKYALNSVIVTGASVVGILLLGAAAAFAFSRYRFRRRNLLIRLLALGCFCPAVLLHRAVHDVHSTGHHRYPVGAALHSG